MIPFEVSASPADLLGLGEAGAAGEGAGGGKGAHGGAFSEGVGGVWGWERGAPAAAAFGEPPWYFIFRFGEQQGETQTGGFRLDSSGARGERSEVQLGPPGFSKGN